MELNMRYALVINGKVDNVIESETAPSTSIGQWIPVTGNIGPGDSYEDGSFVKVDNSKRHITNLAFISRFTDAEAIAIDLASIGSTVPAATLRRYLNKVNAANYIDLNRQDTRDGVNTLESMGILAAGRAAVILDSPIMKSEEYHENLVRI